jgi:DNA-binding CsgD family transcriptional regulator
LSWAEVDPELRKLIERAVTPKQLEVVKLKSIGYGTNRIARYLGITVSSVRDRLERAELRIRKAREEVAGEGAR